MKKTTATSLFLILLLFIVLIPPASAASLWLHTARYEAGSKKPDRVYLHFGDFPFADKPQAANVKIWLKTPNGGIEELALQEDDNDLNAVIKPRYGGLYTALSFYEDKTATTVTRHYGKLNFHRFGGKVKEKKTDKLPIEVPLQIIPVSRLHMHRRLQEGQSFVLKVLYKGTPLANTALTAMTQEGWAKNFCTDSEGKTTVTFIKDRPSKPENKRKSERYLFRTEYKDPTSSENISYVATYTLDVEPSPWEWQSKSMGYLTVLATVIVVGGVTALRRKGK